MTGTGAAGTAGAGGCSEGQHVCGARCVDSASSESCGTSCEPCRAPLGGSALCQGGQCGGACDAGLRLCAGVCIGEGERCNEACPAQTHHCTRGEVRYRRHEPPLRGEWLDLGGRVTLDTSDVVGIKTWVEIPTGTWTGFIYFDEVFMGIE